MSNTPKDIKERAFEFALRILTRFRSFSEIKKDSLKYLKTGLNLHSDTGDIDEVFSIFKNLGLATKTKKSGALKRSKELYR